MAPSKKKILVVDDEADIRELLRYNLEQEGYQVELKEDGEKAFQFLKENRVDLILLDLMLPGMPGLELCKQMKRQADTESIPIIMISAKSSETDVIVGLELGADDYITKPFSPKELVARIKAIFRRVDEKKIDSPREHRFQDLQMDLARHEVKVDGKEVKLTSTEFKILQCLMSQLGHVFSRDELIDFALGKDVSVVDRTIDVHMTNLRKKIGRYGLLIESIRAVGYRFRDTPLS
ncbi:MAG: response regulator with CheY-like receiver domain and winged-helix DNA-binding domain [Bacteriovoracaceae bacterium]|nr:response regulator with CheY-like receiver domain and winged-helix DNA-binding domain [Bacteriovoracaceae bacterium]